METKILLRLIKDDILHLQGITDSFRLDSLPAADEVELALVRAKALFRQLELLHKSIVNSVNQSLNSVVVEETDSSVSKVVSPEQEQIDLIANSSLDNMTFTVNEPIIPVIQVVQQPKLFQQTEVSENEIKSEKPFVNREKPEIIPSEQKSDQSDIVVESEQIVNDLFMQDKSESGYQIIPIKTIRDGIGINDRFLFVRELFGNDASGFEQAVTALDQITTIQEAVNYLKVNFKWQKSEASQKFLDLVKRRFTK